MKVLVAGATGRVAGFLMADLLAAGHEVTAGARHPERIEAQPGLTTVAMDLTASEADLAALLEGHDAIYFTAGSRGKDLLQVDAYGAVALMKAAKGAGVKRFIMLSSLLSLTPERWTDPKVASLRNYLTAKYFADDWLIHRSGLDYTIVQPGTLEEAEVGDGLVTFDVQGFSRNSIPNVAAVLAGLLTADNTVGKVIAMGDGDQTVAQALKEV